jgi:hypothetical protein
MVGYFSRGPEEDIDTLHRVSTTVQIYNSPRSRLLLLLLRIVARLHREGDIEALGCHGTVGLNQIC